jgi:hypothetical protein
MSGARAAAQDTKRLRGEMHGLGRGGQVAAGGVSRYTKAAKEGERHTRSLGRGFVYARKGIGPLRAGVTGLTGALGFGAGVGLIGAFKVMVDEATQAQKTGRQTAAALKSTGASAFITAKHITDMSTSLSNMSGIDDEAIQNGENLLLTFRNIRNEAGKGNDIFDQTTKTMVDFAARFTHGDMERASIMLGKALDNPLKGMTALQRVGVSFDNQTADRVKQLVKENKLREAQKILLAQINPQVKGQAKASTNAMQKLNVIFHNVAEQLGTALLPLIEKGAAKLGKFVTQMANGTGAGGRFAGKVKEVAKQVWAVVKPMGQFVGSAVKFAAANPGLVKAVGAILLLRRLGNFKLSAGLVKLFSGGLGKGGGLKASIGNSPTVLASLAVATQLLADKLEKIKVPKGLTGLKDILVQFVGGPIKLLRTLGSSITHPLTLLKKLGKSFVTFATIVLPEVMVPIRLIAHFFGGPLKSAFNTVWGAAKRLGGFIGGTFHGVIGGIKGPIHAMGDVLHFVGDKAGDAFGGLKHFLGLKTSADELKASLQGIADASRSAAQAFIDHPLPSASQLSGRGNSLGAQIPGYGGGDKFVRRLEGGEYVVRKEAVRRVGRSFMDRLNMGGMQTGGLVAPTPVAVGGGDSGEIVILNRLYLGPSGEREIARGVARVVRDDRNRR